MVAPFSDGRIARSMVRIPGSGPDENAVPVCLNLGNVSRFAALVPVPDSVTFSTRSGRRSQLTSSFTLGGVGGSSANQKLAGETTTSPLPSPLASPPTGDVIVKSEDFKDSPALITPGEEESSPAIQAAAAAAIRNGVNNVRASSVVVSATPALESERKDRGTQVLKRPIRQLSTETSQVQPPSKRSREEACLQMQDYNSSSSRRRISGNSKNGRNFNPTSPKTTFATATMAVPLGSWGTPSGNSSTSPPVNIYLPVTFANGQSVALQVAVPQANSGSSSSSSSSSPPPNFVLQAVPTIIPARAAAAGSPSDDALQKICRERDHLRKENEALKYRLVRFHQLMRSKKLFSVLRRLEAVPA